MLDEEVEPGQSTHVFVLDVAADDDGPTLRDLFEVVIPEKMTYCTLWLIFMFSSWFTTKIVYELLYTLGWVSRC